MRPQENFMSEAADKIVRMLARRMQVQPEQIDGSRRIADRADIDDSLAFLDFIGEVEETFAVCIPDEALDKVQSLDDLVRAVEGGMRAHA